MIYQIVCTTRQKDDQNVIDKLGYVQEGGNTSQAQNVTDKETVNKMIQDGSSFFFTNKNGKKISVIAVEDTHVRTKPDETEDNNLLHLRFCNI